MPSSIDIKRALREAGFEVYRTDGAVVHIAERVRENLIMDSGVRLDNALGIGFYARAERHDFPGDRDEVLYERARSMGASAENRGFTVQRMFTTVMTDPGDASRTLDVWFQVHFEKRADTLEKAIEEVRFAFALPKQARREAG
jgi:hypothetical protein